MKSTFTYTHEELIALIKRDAESYSICNKAEKVSFTINRGNQFEDDLITATVTIDAKRKPDALEGPFYV